MQPCIIMMTSSYTFLGGVQCIRHVNANDIAYDDFFLQADKLTTTSLIPFLGGSTVMIRSK